MISYENIFASDFNISLYHTINEFLTKRITLIENKLTEILTKLGFDPVNHPKELYNRLQVVRQDDSMKELYQLDGKTILINDWTKSDIEEVKIDSAGFIEASLPLQYKRSLNIRYVTGHLVVNHKTDNIVNDSSLASLDDLIKFRNDLTKIINAAKPKIDPGKFSNKQRFTTGFCRPFQNTPFNPGDYYLL